MNKVLLPFQRRTTLEPVYQHPIVDVLTDNESALAIEVPVAPQMTFVSVGSAGWLTVAFADSYVLQRLTEGTDYVDILTIADDGSDEMTISSVEVTSPGFYRVRAVNAAGDGPPSAPMDLNVPDNPDPEESSSSSGPGLVPVAWWPMEENNADRVDAVGGLVLAQLSKFAPPTAGDIAGVTGKVGNAAFIYPTATPATWPALKMADQSPQLAYSGTGFTVCGWCKILAAGDADLPFTPTLIYVQFGDSWPYISAYISSVSSGGADQVTLGFTDSTGYSERLSATVSLTEWFFFRFWFDPVSSLVKLQINDGTPVASSGSPELVMNSAATGYCDIEGAGHGSSYLMDEVAIFDRALTDEEAAYIYNGGAGRTWPFV